MTGNKRSERCSPLCFQRPDLSVVLGSLNRRRLLKQTIRNIRENGFRGTMEIIVVDGGSTDGTCEWLARQADVLTFIQPNYKVSGPNGELRRAHSWGEFMNLGFRQTKAPWILMISDDLVLCRGAIQNGVEMLNELQRQGRRIGGGAIYFREYPRERDYRVVLLPGGYIHINHGFFWNEAMQDVGYADEENFEFYGADGDLTMRLNLAGWTTVALEKSYAEHLNHRARWRNLFRREVQTPSDMQLFFEKYKSLPYDALSQTKAWSDNDRLGRVFWKADPWSCIQGVLRSRLRILKTKGR